MAEFIAGGILNNSFLFGYEYNFRRELRGLHGLKAALQHCTTEKNPCNPRNPHLNYYQQTSKKFISNLWFIPGGLWIPQSIATLLFAFPYTTTKSLSSNKCIFDATKVYK